MAPLRLLLYQTGARKSPVLKWIAELREEEWAECYSLIVALQEDGNELEFPDSAPLGKGLFELRGSVERVQLRMLYCFLPKANAVVLCGFVKQQPQTPKRELERARERQSQVLNDPDRWTLSFTLEELVKARQLLQRRPK